jgi:hypothetical protein
VRERLRLADQFVPTLAYYRAVIDREAQLLLVGSYRGHREYYARLRELQRALGLETAVRSPVG